MILKILWFVLILIVIASSGVCSAQIIARDKAKSVESPNVAGTKSTAAYAELLLRKTELQADLESLILEYTEEYPKVKEIRFTLGLIQKESDRMFSVKFSDASKFTLALGKLIVRKIELEIDLWGLLKNYNDGHPDVKRAKRKVEIYESAIREILG
ncbi:MAG: hypothetical protein M3Q26_12185 [Acidobacteriota bacterium]|nr:hypothetical protein [Acidobacteriota bacterium]